MLFYPKDIIFNFFVKNFLENVENRLFLYEDYNFWYNFKVTLAKK